VQLFFSLSVLAFLPLFIFSIAIIVPYSTTSHLPDLSLTGNTGFWTAEKPPPKTLQFVCTARSIQHRAYLLPMSLH